MFRTLTNYAIVTLALILVVASTASAAKTQTLWGEDFEDGDGTAVGDYGWTSTGAPGDLIQINSTSNLPTGAYDGDTYGAGTGARIWSGVKKAVPGVAASAANPDISSYTLSVDMAVFYAGHTNGTGNVGVHFAGNSLGFYYSRSNNRGWRLETNALAAGQTQETHTPGLLANTPVRGTMIYDMATNMLSGRLVEISNPSNSFDFTPVPFTDGELSSISTDLTIYSDINPYPTVYGDQGIDVDNFLITQTFRIPEPATLSLLGLGGLAMLRRRRA